MNLVQLICVIFTIIITNVHGNDLENSTETTILENSTTKLLKEDFYIKTNVKYPAEETKSLPQQLKMRQIVFLIGGIATCCVLLIGFSLVKFLTNRSDTRQQSRRLLTEARNDYGDDTNSLLESSDDEGFTVPPILTTIEERNRSEIN